MLVGSSTEKLWGHAVMGIEGQMKMAIGYEGEQWKLKNKTGEKAEHAIVTECPFSGCVVLRDQKVWLTFHVMSGKLEIHARRHQHRSKCGTSKQPEGQESQHGSTCGLPCMCSNITALSVLAIHASMAK